MVKNKRDYRREILKILEKHDEIRGFNKLCKLGNFHRTSLQKNLKELELSGKIIIHNNEFSKTVYFLAAYDYDSITQAIFPQIFQLKEKLPTLTEESDKKILKRLSRELFSSYFSVDLLLLGFYEFDIIGKKLDMIKKTKKWLESELLFCFYHLATKDQKEILFHKTPKNQGEELLKKFRKIWKKYDIE